jgi:hypothetical protein
MEDTVPILSSGKCFRNCIIYENQSDKLRFQIQKEL